MCLLGVARQDEPRAAWMRADCLFCACVVILSVDAFSGVDIRGLLSRLRLFGTEAVGTLPFALPWLHAMLPSLTGDHVASAERLHALLLCCRRCAVDSAAAPASRRLWGARRERVTLELAIQHVR